MKRRYFAVVSAEHPSLPLAEIKATLEAEEISYVVEFSRPGLAFLESTEQAEIVCHRNALTKLLCLHLFTCENDPNTIEGKVGDIDPAEMSDEPTSFAVRVKRAPAVCSRSRATDLEPLVGGLLAQRLKHWRVDLERPTVEFCGLLWGDKFVLGVKRYEREAGVLRGREPSVRPAFHPATLTPKLARAMVNLARAKRGLLLADPFCGVGGILIEAGLLGCRLVGGDAKLEMCNGAVKNLRHYGLAPLAVVQSDAVTPPLMHADAVATDPPYGTSASTFKRTTRSILQDFFPAWLDVLGDRRFLCIAAPHEVGAKEIGVESGFKYVESYQIFIHRSLTREITVFQKQ